MKTLNRMQLRKLILLEYDRHGEDAGPVDYGKGGGGMVGGSGGFRGYNIDDIKKPSFDQFKRDLEAQELARAREREESGDAEYDRMQSRIRQRQRDDERYAEEQKLKSDARNKERHYLLKQTGLLPDTKYIGGHSNEDLRSAFNQIGAALGKSDDMGNQRGQAGLYRPSNRHIKQYIEMQKGMQEPEERGFFQKVGSFLTGKGFQEGRELSRSQLRRMIRRTIAEHIKKDI
jgi:hypothetical protein